MQKTTGTEWFQVSGLLVPHKLVLGHPRQSAEDLNLAVGYLALVGGEMGSECYAC